MYDMSVLESNLDAVLRPLTGQEEQVADYLEKGHFSLSYLKDTGRELNSVPTGTQ